MGAIIFGVVFGLVVLLWFLLEDPPKCFTRKRPPRPKDR